MSQKKPITVTIDPEVLARVDRVAELRGESRSATIERITRNGIDDEEKFLDVMGGPVAGRVITALLGNPKLHGMLAKFVQEEMTAEQIDELAAKVPPLREAGLKHRQEKKEKKA